MEGKIVYFEKPGRDNTEATLAIAKQRAEELGLKTVLVASTVGDTAVRSVDVFKGMKVIAVTHATGFREPDFQEFTDANRKAFESKGGIVLTARHAFIGLTRQPSPNDFGDIVANTLRMLSQGVKVVAEITVMAADAGMVSCNEDVMVVCGSGRGADTAAVVRPANSRDLFRLRIKELLCKPHFPAPPPLSPPPTPGAPPPAR